MSWSRETLQEIRDRIEADMVTDLGLTGPVLRHAALRIFSRGLAGLSHMMLGRISFLLDQIFPDRSEVEFLRRQATIKGINENAATFSTGNILLTGTDGASVVTGRELYRPDGAGYTTQSDVTISGGSVLVTVKALIAGKAGDCDTGTQLSFASPAPGVDSTALVQSPGLSGGADAEEVEAFRARLLAALREEPRGGTEYDYVRWMLEVPGVTRAWSYPLENGLGTVVCRFVRDADVDLIPDAGEVTTVNDYLLTKRPATAQLTTEAPTKLLQAFTLSVTPDTSTKRAAIELEIDDLFFRKAKPGDGDGGGTVLLADILTAIGIGAGGSDWSLTTPSADVVPDLGELAMRGTMTWV